MESTPGLLKKRTAKRRTDRCTALRIDVGLIIRAKLGSEKVASALYCQGIQSETISRVLGEQDLRRPALPGEVKADRRAVLSKPNRIWKVW
jgi:hypothetical protein